MKGPACFCYHSHIVFKTALHKPSGVTALMGERGNSLSDISKGIGGSNGAGGPGTSAPLAFILKRNIRLETLFITTSKTTT